MESAAPVRFAEVARMLAAAARARGLAAPAFRSPPRIAGACRSIRWYPGGAVVAVQLRGRRFEGVQSDMVEGVIVANRLEGEAADRLRAALAAALSVHARDRPSTAAA
jgi:hypothetical protein